MSNPSAFVGDSTVPLDNIYLPWIDLLNTLAQTLTAAGRKPHNMLNQPVYRWIFNPSS